MHAGCLLVMMVCPICISGQFHFRDFLRMKMIALFNINPNVHCSCPDFFCSFTCACYCTFILANQIISSALPKHCVLISGFSNFKIAIGRGMCPIIFMLCLNIYFNLIHHFAKFITSSVLIQF